jgi:hypothetical protein
METILKGRILLSMRLAPALNVAVIEGDLMVVEENRGVAEGDMEVVKEDMAAVKVNTAEAVEGEGVIDKFHMA